VTVSLGLRERESALDDGANRVDVDAVTSHGNDAALIRL